MPYTLDPALFNDGARPLGTKDIRSLGVFVTVGATTTSGADYGPGTPVDPTNAVNTFGIYEAVKAVIAAGGGKVYVQPGAYDFTSLGGIPGGCLVPVLGATNVEIEFAQGAVITLPPAPPSGQGGVFLRYAGCTNLEIHGGKFVYSGNAATTAEKNMGAISGVGGNFNCSVHDIALQGFTKYAVSEKGGCTSGEGGPVIGAYPPCPDPAASPPVQNPTSDTRFYNLTGTSIGAIGADGALVMIANQSPARVYQRAVTAADASPVTAFTAGSLDALWYVKGTVIPTGWGQTSNNPVTLTVGYTDWNGVARTMSVSIVENDTLGRCEAQTIRIKNGTAVTTQVTVGGGGSFNAATALTVNVEVYNPVTRIFIDATSGTMNYFGLDIGNQEASSGSLLSTGAAATGNFIGGFKTVRITGPCFLLLDEAQSSGTSPIFIEDQTPHEDIVILGAYSNGYFNGVSLTGRNVQAFGVVDENTAQKGLQVRSPTNNTFPHWDARWIAVHGGDVSFFNKANNAGAGGISIVAGATTGQSPNHSSLSFVEIDSPSVHDELNKSAIYLDFSGSMYASTNWYIHGGRWTNTHPAGLLQFTGTLGAALGGANLTGAVGMPTGAAGIRLEGLDGAETSTGALGVVSTPLDANGGLSVFGTLAANSTNWTTGQTKVVSGSRLTMFMTGGTISAFTVEDAGGNVKISLTSAPTNFTFLLNIGDQVTLSYTVFPTSLAFAYAS